MYIFLKGDLSRVSWIYKYRFQTVELRLKESIESRVIFSCLSLSSNDVHLSRGHTTRLWSIFQPVEGTGVNGVDVYPFALNPGQCLHDRNAENGITMLIK